MTRLSIAFVFTGSLLLTASLGCTTEPLSTGSTSSSSTSSSSQSAGGGGTGGSSVTTVGSAMGGGGATGTGGGAPKPVVEIDTSFGMMAVELEPELMPITTENFLTYVDEDFYSGTIIHRVIPDFVIQGGGFTSGLSSKPATHAPIVLETSPEVLHEYGAISMARTNDPNSATTQFFLVNAVDGAGSLDGNYAAFGKLIEGSEVLDAISAVETTSMPPYDDVPVEEVTVNSITLR